MQNNNYRAQRGKERQIYLGILKGNRIKLNFCNELLVFLGFRPIRKIIKLEHFYFIMVKLTEDSSYSLKGAFPQFLKQTDEKKITVKYILSKLREKYSFSNYTKFSFTDIGAGEGAVTSSIIEFLRRNVNLEVHLIEPSSLMKILKKRCGPNGFKSKNSNN